MLVVYVSPFLRQDVPLFIDRLTRLPGVRVALISDRPDESLPLPDSVRQRLHGVWRVRTLTDSAELTWAARGLSEHLGPINRIFTENEHIQVPVAETRTRLNIPGMPLSTMLNFRDKSRMKEKLRSHGVPCARFASVSDWDEAFEFVRKVGYPVIVKPVAGVGAHSTFKASNDFELARTLQWNPPHPTEPLQMEEFVVGEEASLDTISLRGKPVWHSITRYSPTPLDVMRNPWIQWRIVTPLEVDDWRNDDVKAVGAQALAALGMETGLSHLEWFRRADGSLAVGEVGARPAGSRIFTAMNWANDFDMYHAWTRLMALGEWTPPAERKYAVGTAFLRGQGGGRVRRVHGLDDVLREFRSMVVEQDIPEVGQPKGTTYDGEGYLMVRHRETAVVERVLREIITRVQVELG